MKLGTNLDLLLFIVSSSGQILIMVGQGDDSIANGARGVTALRRGILRPTTSAATLAFDS
jgi:hypothetical protein